MIVEGWNENGERRAVELDKANRAYGWVYYWNRAYSNWATLRKATPEELDRAGQASVRVTGSEP